MFVLSLFREDEDASHCAVPISTSLIKQILNKTGHEDNPENILADFYGPKRSNEPPWPYVIKDAGRYSLHCTGRFDVGYMFARVQSAVNISLLADVCFFSILYLKTVFFLFIKTPRDLFNK